MWFSFVGPGLLQQVARWFGSLSAARPGHFRREVNRDNPDRQGDVIPDSGTRQLFFSNYFPWWVSRLVLRGLGGVWHKLLQLSVDESLHVVAQDSPMSDRVAQSTPLVFDGFMRFRVPAELKQEFAEIAQARCKTESELAREVFVNYLKSHTVTAGGGQ
jgi:hypothetical protein